MISRIDLFDQMVREITKMGINKHTSELDKRVLYAIDIFGLSDDATALEIRLLLSEGDKDYLAWKLSEKVAFLVADTSEWRVAQERYGRPHTN